MPKHPNHPKSLNIALDTHARFTAIIRHLKQQRGRCVSANELLNELLDAYAAR